MSSPERMGKIRRLFLAKLEKMPSDMPHEKRVEAARFELDQVLGPEWRKEVEEAGVDLDPTGDMAERLDRLPMATREAGFHGDDIPMKNKPKEEDKEDEGTSIIIRLMKFIHGK